MPVYLLVASLLSLTLLGPHLFASEVGFEDPVIMDGDVGGRWIFYFLDCSVCRGPVVELVIGSDSVLQ